MCILLVNHHGILLTALNICNVVSTLTLEQRVVLSKKRLWEFRGQGRPFETHNSLTTSRNIVPYPVNPVNWFIFYNLLRNFLDDTYYGTILDNRPVLYLHTDVYSPPNVQLYPMYRSTIYNMFLFNTPPELYFLIDRIKFRLFFMSTFAIPHEEIFIENLSFRTEYSAP